MNDKGMCNCSQSDCKSEKMKSGPRKLSFSLIDYFKALYSWIRAFRKTFIVEPGLYFIGESYDIKTPLIVTANYHMTVFNIWRYLKGKNVRILIINTEGINVWCSSGKGKFSAENIVDHLSMYDPEILNDGERVELILPKLTLSGVSLQVLRKNRIKPIIGPIYAWKLPDFLFNKPYKDCLEEKYNFSLRDRFFTLLPSLYQFAYRAIVPLALLIAWNYFTGFKVTWQILPIMFSIIILYIFLFPILPTKNFTVKILPLSLMAVAYLFADFQTLQVFSSDILVFLCLVLFTIGFSVFLALDYTGNTGVSNYSLVKRDTIRFLPLSLISFVISFVFIIIGGLIS